jgi:hypothetical protein
MKITMCLYIYVLETEIELDTSIAISMINRYLLLRNWVWDWEGLFVKE